MATPKSKLFSFEFEGHWPVGACGIVKATNKTEARQLAESWIFETEGLDRDLEDENFSEVKLQHGQCKILLNGDY